MRERIIGTPPPPAPRRATRHRRRRRVATIALAGACLAGVAAIGVDRLATGPQPAWAAPLLRAAEGSPRLLVEGGGWSVARADELAPGTGETVHVNGAEQVQLNWYRAADRPLRDHRPDRDGAGPVGTTAVLGDPVRIFRYVRSDRYVASWRRDGWTLELDGEAASEDRFVAILHALRATDVDTWLAAMPASTVRLAERGAVVDEMLRDVPIPPGLDLPALREGAGRVRDRYQLGAEVSGAVACGWIARWLAAERDGDRVAADAAAAALATSRRWAILVEMDRSGDYPEAVWRYASALEGAAVALGGSVEETHRAALGCAVR